MNGGTPPHSRMNALSWPRWWTNSSFMMWKATAPDHEEPHGVGTIAASSASPMRLTAAFARSKHSRAKAIRAGLPSSAATLSSPASSTVIRPFATPSAMSRTQVEEMCTASSAGVRMPGTGWVE